MTNFTDQYSGSPSLIWDELIDWDGRHKAENEFFSKILNKNNCTKIIDLATGTGYHAITLSKKGFDVTALDYSRAMLEKAAKNAHSHETDIKFIQCDWRDIQHKISDKYHAAICLGSSFPHLIDKKDRILALNNFFSILEEDGILIIDHRNFDSLINGNFSNKGNQYYCGKEFKVSAKLEESGLVRFSYDNSQNHFELSVYPITLNELKEELMQCGFADHQVFGDFASLTQIDNVDFIIHIVKKRN